MDGDAEAGEPAIRGGVRELGEPYRMLGRATTVAVDLDSIFRVAGRYARLNVIAEVPQLSALLVTPQYSGSIALVRLMRRTAAEC